MNGAESITPAAGGMCVIPWNVIAVSPSAPRLPGVLALLHVRHLSLLLDRPDGPLGSPAILPSGCDPVEVVQ